MAADSKDQGSKQKIAEGMSESGKDAARQEDAKPGGASGSDQITEGMAKSGSGTATGADAPPTKRR
jgi:hypothetical protein